MRLRGTLLLFFSILLVPLGAEAHRASDSYLTLTVEDGAVLGRWDLALRDLDHAIGLDGNDDGAITWGEVRGRHQAIAAYALSRLSLTADGMSCTAQAVDHLVERHGDSAYSALEFTADCPAAGPIDELVVSYGAFFDLDPQHRGLLRLVNGDTTASAVFAPDSARQSFALRQPNSLRVVADYLREGVHHIWIGFDHVLFLLTLLLPAALRRRDGRWIAVDGLAPALGRIAGIVSAFTVAHSLTLGLAALGIVDLPSRLVEAAIAASVVLAAVNNIVPIITRRLWLMAFGFGLIHGFGFAGVLADLGLPADALAIALLGFNLGVELGQLAIVAALLPPLYLLRNAQLYARLALPAGSVAAAQFGSIWFLERALP